MSNWCLGCGMETEDGDWCSRCRPFSSKAEEDEYWRKLEENQMKHDEEMEKLPRTLEDDDIPF